MIFRPRSITSKVGVRPIIERRLILGNLRYIELLQIVSLLVFEKNRCEATSIL